MTSTYGSNGFFRRWFEAMFLSLCGLSWQSWAISSASYVPRRYLGPSLMTWRKLHLCCSVSWRRSFHQASSLRCFIWSYTSQMRFEWEGLCNGVGAFQSREIWRLFARNVETKPKLRLPLQRHPFWRRCPTSLKNTTLRTFLACIIHPLVTMLEKMNRLLAFFEANSARQVDPQLSSWTMKSGERSCYTCLPTLMSWTRTWGKLLSIFIQFIVTFQHHSFCFVQWISSFVLEWTKASFWCGSWNPNCKWCRAREAWFHFLVPTEGTVLPRSYLVWRSNLLLRSDRIMIYLASPCRLKPMRLWVKSWDRLQKALTVGSSHLTVTTWMDFASTHQATSRVGPIEKPQIAEFVLQAMTTVTTMEELKKYTNFHFTVKSLWILSCSNAIGLILEERGWHLILG